MSGKPIHLEERVSHGARIISPTAARNCGPIADVLSARLPAESRVLEIASGTGQQMAAVTGRRPDIYWQPSDPDADSRASQQTYHAERPGAIASPVALDVTDPSAWAVLPGTYTNMFCANMIHIAPIEALYCLAVGAGAILPTGGQMFLYGPFLFGGESAQSNLDFSDRLNVRDSRWAVRESDFVKHIFAKSGFTACEQIAMPAENHILIFSKP